MKSSERYGNERYGKIYLHIKSGRHLNWRRPLFYLFYPNLLLKTFAKNLRKNHISEFSLDFLHVF